MSDRFEDGVLIRIFIGEADSVEGGPLFEKLILAAKEHGIGGATVVRGIESYGQDGTIHTARLLRLSEDLPVVVEIAEKPDIVETFLPIIDELFDKSGGGGVVTTESVKIKKYKSSKK